ncbi:MAG TPA: M1 family aminopeptidase [Wenzhouxiangellaceae bacterium]|nr:M1 family aminopeptidase [Wenzhouxiangellaceae bacterium]
MKSRFFPIARFEAAYQLKSPVFLVSFVLFFLLAFGGITSDNIQMGGVGNVNVNSPDAITQNILIFSLIAMFVVIAFVANVVLRDVESRSAEMFYSTPIGKFEYLLGRFSGAFAVSVLLLIAIPFGIMVGVQMPWLDPERLGPFVFSNYLQPFLIYGVVNLFFASAIAFALATLTRSMAMTYVVIVGYFLLTGVIGAVTDIFNSTEHRALLAMFDPFGSAAYQEVVRYWTAFERNEQLAPLTGLILGNRLIWLALSLGVLAFTVKRFRFDVQPRGRKAKAGKESAEPVVAAPQQVTIPAVRAAYGAGVKWKQFVSRVGFEVRSVVLSVPFMVLVLFALMITILNFLSLDQFFQTAVYPVTRLMTQIMQGTFTLSILIVVIYYSAELVWREREARMHEVIDSTPVPGWVQAGSKMLAMILVLVVLMTIGIVTSMLFQLSQGHTDLQPMVYLTRHLLDYGMLFYVMAIFGVFVQTLVPNKFAGMGVLVLFVISLFVLDPLGLEDPLYQLGAAPGAAYSDMTGWDYFAWIQSWYSVYWLFFCLLLFVGAHLVWRRGGMDSLRLRIRRAGANLTPGIATLGVVALAGFLGAGSFIFYNTRILNDYVTDQDLERISVEYEKRYRENEDLPQPRIAAIDNRVDLYPSERRYGVQGAYRLENRSGEPVPSVFVGFNPAVEVLSVALAGKAADEVDDEFAVYRFDLDRPMQPGAEMELTFSTERANRGFKHARNAQPALGGGSATVLGNGSFVYGGDAMPYIGFSRGQIITDRNDRRKYDLPPIDRAPDLDDMDAARNSYLSRDSDWMDFRTVVSTEADQVAVAPGYLQREWEEDGRRYFEYEMDAPMQNLVAYLSARYAVESETVDGVDLSVYYHPEHDWNVEHMMETMRKSLDYFQANFSPYQYRQMRILEFPAFLGNFAQSFPNTIQWSEGLGFIAKLDDPSDIDYVFYVGAHEMAHQWWGHQVSSADVQGGTALVETLAQYSALMVMEDEYGPDMMRRFLAFELDNYLSSRGSESREELPLVRVENQGYIHYRKGSLVMYALKDYLGEDRINEALASLIDEVAYQYDPYPRSVDLIRNLKAIAETGDEIKLIEDLFERITLWDLATEDAAVTENEDGTFTVTIDVNASKLEADGLGRETEVELDMPIDIGVFTMRPDDDEFSSEAVLHLQKHRLTSGTNSFEFTVDRRPAAVGVDPYHKLIDRKSDDNLKSL